jgi:phosphoribosylpyrophosphate synthetase
MCHVGTLHASRYGKMFEGFPLVICGKVRIGDSRVVTIHEGEPEGKRMLIVDDMVRSGGTLVKCCEALKARGALAGVTFHRFPR